MTGRNRGSKNLRQDGAPQSVRVRGGYLELYDVAKQRRYALPANRKGSGQFSGRNVPGRQR